MSRNSAGQSIQSHFSKIPSANIQRSVFDRSSGHKTAFDAGVLIPFFVDEVLPGDTMKLQTSFLARLATPVFPYMDNVELDFHYWFVPNRLVWDNWEKFCGSQVNPGDSTDFLVPQLSAVTHAAGFAENSIFDYLGIPTKIPAIVQADMPNALVLRAYNLIWNEWYRDENLQNSLPVVTTDGPDTTAFALQRRGRRKDYFTSSLPWPQKGPAVTLALGGDAPVQTRNAIADARVIASPPDNTNQGLRWTNRITGAEITTAQTLAAYQSGVPTSYTGITTTAAPALSAGVVPRNLFADLSLATAGTINQIRQAVTLQQFFELDARGGTRYVELLLAHFGVVSPDFRLQRPEYLGGGSVPINVNPIAQTSKTDVSPQGNLAAFATARGTHGVNHSFVEHGHVIGIVSARADTTYQDGLNKMWSRRTRYDYYWPTFSHLGEQTVLNKEIYMAASTVQNNAVFGYQERYAEYRYKPSIVTGVFRSNATATLDSWHLALDFPALPTLAGLVTEDPPMARIIAVDSEPDFIMDSYTRLRHVRPMPTYSVPGLTRF